MIDTTALRSEIISALDPRFTSHGFSRRARAYSWLRPAKSAITHILHLNFGLYPDEGRVSVVPTLGVRHESLERALVAAGVVVGSRDRSSVSLGLMNLAGVTAYEVVVTQGPIGLADTLWADWCAVGRPALDQLSDMNEIVRMLRSDDPAEWCTPHRSMRARLFPLALWVNGRREEALEALEAMERDIVGRDQLHPPFEQFATWLRAQAA